MSLRVLQVCCVRPPPYVALADLLDRWPTLRDVAEATANAGADVTVLVDGARDDELSRADVRYRRIAGLGRPRWRHPLTPRAAAIARACQPDVIHMAGFDAPLTTRALCGTGIPVLAQDHANRPRAGALAHWGFAKLAAAAFTARDQAVPFLRAGQLRADLPIFAIPESSSRFTPGPRDKARTLYGIHGAPALLWVGHLDANKNPMMVLRAVQRVMARLPGITLWCAFGKAPLLPEIQTLLASDPDLAARVHLLGHIRHAEMETLYRACDGFVSASRREGSGYALIEALACGCRVIVTDIPSFRALTGDGAVGTLVPDDSDAMADAILREFSDGGEGGARRVEVRRHFDRHLSFEAVGAALVGAYADLVRG